MKIRSISTPWGKKRVQLLELWPVAKSRAQICQFRKLSRIPSTGSGFRVSVYV